MNPAVVEALREIGIDLSTEVPKLLTDAAAREADVVVTNPTHFAVALEYKPEMAAPVVVAKGCNQLAEKMDKAERVLEREQVFGDV